jgi:hypothetical protein
MIFMFMPFHVLPRICLPDTTMPVARGTAAGLQHPGIAGRPDQDC